MIKMLKGILLANFINDYYNGRHIAVIKMWGNSTNFIITSYYSGFIIMRREILLISLIYYNWGKFITIGENFSTNLGWEVGGLG